MRPSLFDMRRTIFLTALLAAALLGLGALSTAQAASPGQIINDCTDSPDGTLQGTYTKADLRQALKKVTGDIAEYTNCYDAITQELARSPRRGGGPNGDGTDDGPGAPGSDTPGTGPDSNFDGGVPTGGPGGNATGPGAGDGSTPADGAAAPAPLTAPQAGSNEPVRLAGTTIRPGTIPSVGRDANELPGALIVLLVVLGAGAVAVVGTTLGRRVLARRRA